ncbi:LysR family transcriptional regulator [Luteibacter sp. PPL193]|nr:LysR family transcriptional regulator [Luteibacter sp. PPL193]
MAAADHGSFSAAARALGKTQSLVSYSVKRMEDQLGVTLFDRSAYRPSITVAGSTLLARARRICNEVNVFQAVSRELAAGAETEVRLAVDAMFPMCDLYRALKAFRLAWPDVSPRVIMHNAGGAASEVMDHEATLGLLDGTSQIHPELDVVTVAPAPVIAVVSAHHPLATIAKEVRSEDLTDHVQIALFDPDARGGGRRRCVRPTSGTSTILARPRHAPRRVGMGRDAATLGDRRSCVRKARRTGVHVVEIRSHAVDFRG